MSNGIILVSTIINLKSSGRMAWTSKSRCHHLQPNEFKVKIYKFINLKKFHHNHQPLLLVFPHLFSCFSLCFSSFFLIFLFLCWQVSNGKAQGEIVNFLLFPFLSFTLKCLCFIKSGKRINLLSHENIFHHIVWDAIILQVSFILIDKHEKFL